MTGVTEDQSRDLALFHYEPLWLESGLLARELLQSQVAAYVAGEDPHKEHYRWKAFGAVLRERESLTDAELDTYVSLSARDPDQSMARSALISLVQWDGLTAAQYEALKGRPEFRNDPVRPFFERREIAEELERTGPTDELVSRVVTLENGFRGFQRTVVEHPDLTEAQLRLFAERGANRAIRNVAAARLLRWNRKHR